jgi:hypothetical protein
VPGRSKRSARRTPRAPDRLLSHGERLAIRTSRLWIAGYANLRAEWHPTRNVGIYPYELSHGSNRRVWWKCANGPDHEWQAVAASRVPRNGRRATGCPFCDGKRFSKTNSLLARFPALAAEWHRGKNGALRPASVIATSRREVWWKCRAGSDHEWRESIRHRTRTSTKCPFCTGRKLSVTNSLGRRYPHLARQWHQERNGWVTPADVRWGDRRSVWWRCDRGPDHEWRATIVYRTTDPKCPFCTGKRSSVTNSLAAKHPSLARQWHPKRNGALKPTHVQPSSTRRVWWRCFKGPDHEWQATVVARSIKGSGCPFCAHRAVSAATSLATLYPALAREWHASKNRCHPSEIMARSKQLAWWRCSRGHEWRARVQDRTDAVKASCPICSSIAGRYPDAAKTWHPTKNGSLGPSEVKPGSRRNIWWRCSENRHHVWRERPLNKFRLGHGCPWCEKRRGYPSDR